MSLIGRTKTFTNIKLSTSNSLATIEKLKFKSFEVKTTSCYLARAVLLSTTLERRRERGGPLGQDVGQCLAKEAQSLSDDDAALQNSREFD